MTAAFPRRAVRVRTPATCANLGPGFDALGLALAMYDEVTAQVADRGVEVTVHGEGAVDLPCGPEHLVVRAMTATFDQLGAHPSGLRLTCVNRIPQARGLGSSSAAIVAGILLARALTPGGDQQLDAAATLRLAAELEGHPDNVAPCLSGGFTIAWTAAGGAHAVRLEPAPAVTPVVLIPADRGLTAEARAALPASVPHRDAAVNVGRAALLVHAMTAAPEHLFTATEDLLHQPYRAASAPATAQLVATLREAGLPAVVSGAGPTVLVLGPRNWTPPELVGWRVLPLGVDRSGAGIVRIPDTVEHAEQDAVAAGPAS